MPQAQILNQFEKYLVIVSRDYLKELKNKIKKLANKNNKTILLNKIRVHRKYIQQMRKKLNKCCHGFAICHAVMDCLGKLPWWESVLKSIYEWNGLRETLYQPILLPDGNVGDSSPNLADIMFRALNYIIYHQGSVKRNAEFLPKCTNQYNLLHPKKEKHKFSHIEIAISNHSHTHIKNYAMVAGNFTNEELCNLLDSKQVQNNICLVSNGYHTIRIGFNEKRWLLYNPSTNYANFTRIHRKLKNKKQLVVAIRRILKTNALRIQIASLQDQGLHFFYFDHIFKKNKLNLIKENGFHLIAKFMPHYVNRLFIFLKRNPDTNLLTSIACSLNKKNKHGFNGLYYLIKFSSASLAKLLSLIRSTKNKELIQAMASALVERLTDQKTSGLQLLARYNKNATKNLISMLNKENYNSLLKAIILALPQKDHQGENGFCTLLLCAPLAVNKLFRLVANLNQPKLLDTLISSIVDLLKLLSQFDLKKQEKCLTYIEKNLIHLNAHQLTLLIERIRIARFMNLVLNKPRFFSNNPWKKLMYSSEILLNKIGEKSVIPVKTGIHRNSF